MKRILKKNQIVLTLLAVMIAVAGYLNYSAGRKEENTQAAMSGEGSVLDGTLDISEEDILKENQSLEEAMSETQAAAVVDDIPGSAVFTSGTDIFDYVAGIQLSREQTRAKNKETLMALIDDVNVNEAMKQEATDKLLKLTSVSDRETAAEALLAASGFANSVVYINDDSVDVIICLPSLTDAERAQIEDIVKRKAEVPVDQLFIKLFEQRTEQEE